MVSLVSNAILDKFLLSDSDSVEGSASMARMSVGCICNAQVMTPSEYLDIEVGACHPVSVLFWV